MKRRIWLPAWLAFQATVAAAAAWLIANLVHAEDRPFFAPVAAVIALTAPRGRRGTKAVQVLLGVFLGIVVGEIVVALMGAGYGRLAIATFIALCGAAAIGDRRIALTQAGTSAILTVIASNGRAGWQRLLDAAIGGTVALTFTQFIFSPEPVALLRDAETDALKGIARGLSETADALRETDQPATRAMKTLSALPARLSELARLREDGARTAQHSLLWRSQRPEIAREALHAGQLAIVADGSVMLARASLDAPSATRAVLAERIHALAGILERLAEAPGDRAVRQQAVDDALAVSRPLNVGGESDPNVDAAVAILGVIARDLLIFAGLTPTEASMAMLGTTARTEVPTPPASPNLPFGLDRRRTRRRASDEPSNPNADRSDGSPTT